MGLSPNDPDQSYASLRYAWNIQDGGALGVYESGVSKGLLGTYAAGDLLRVEVSGGVVRYLQQVGGQRAVECVVHEHGGPGVSAAGGHDDLHARGAAAERAVWCRDVSLRGIANCER